MFENIGKGSIVVEGIFERFPELKPAVGEKYISNEHNRMLIIGESNYLDDSYMAQADFKNAEKWYKDSKAKLIPKAKESAFSNWVGPYKKYNDPFGNLFSSIRKVLQDAGKMCDQYALQETAYYNYFLRPATISAKGYSFKKDCKPIDREVSGIALCGIIEQLKPNLVVFASRYAYLEFSKYVRTIGFQTNAIIDFVNHPSNNFQCWKKDNGAKKFEALMKQYFIK